MDVHIAELAERQHGNVGWEQLIDLGLHEAQVLWRLQVGRLVLVHDGVFAVGHRPRTAESAWMAATLTAPGTYLSHASCGESFGFFRNRGSFEVVVRIGSGGPRFYDDLLVMRTKSLDHDVTTRDGIPMTTAARCLVDLSSHVDHAKLARMTREALRLRATTPDELWTTLARHRGRRGTRALRAAAERYCALPVDKARSDAEVLAFDLLVSFGRPRPLLNEGVAGYEADLIWPEQRVIIELDGGQVHRYTAADDADRDAAWRADGWTVHRLPTDDVYKRPERLLLLAPRR